MAKAFLKAFIDTPFRIPFVVPGRPESVIISDFKRTDGLTHATDGRTHTPSKVALPPLSPSGEFCIYAIHPRLCV